MVKEAVRGVLQEQLEDIQLPVGVSKVSTHRKAKRKTKHAISESDSDDCEAAALASKGLYQLSKCQHCEDSLSSPSDSGKEEGELSGDKGQDSYTPPKMIDCAHPNFFPGYSLSRPLSWFWLCLQCPLSPIYLLEGPSHTLRVLSSPKLFLFQMLWKGFF